MGNDLISDLRSDPNLYGECPECGESFPLRRAIMFYADGPIPPEVQKMIDQREQELKLKIKKFRDDKKKMQKRSRTGATAVGLGKILEKIAPAVEGFKYDPRDCRGLFEPIDYVVFRGLTKDAGFVNSLIFLDIKTGNARLNEHQRQIQKAVEQGKVAWDRYGGRL